MADGTRHVPEVRFAVPMVEDLGYLARNMRDDERDQFAAMVGAGTYDARVAARAYVMTAGPSWVLIDRADRPFAAGGFSEVRPGVWDAWGIGTPEAWVHHWRTITRHCRKAIDDMLAVDAHRVQIVALASRTEAHIWYRRGLGMQEEGYLRGYCADGSDAVVFSKVRGGRA